MPKSFDHTSLVFAPSDQHDQTSGINAKTGVGHGNQSDDELAHHGSQYATSHCFGETNLSPFIKTPDRRRVKLEMPDEPLPKIKTEMNVSSGSFTIRLPKTKRVRACAASDRPVFVVPITRRKTMNDVKVVACESQQPKQKRKRKTMNTTIVGNVKKKQKLNDTAVATAKQFKCDLCEYSTSTNRTLSRHMSSHSNERLHQCYVCLTKFTARGNLNAHMKKHGDMFAYQCSNCRLGFMQKMPWKLHEERCTAKNYVCYLCDKTFYQRRSDLSRHMRIWHTDERPYNCLNCPRKYHLKHELKRHQQYHHEKWIWIWMLLMPNALMCSLVFDKIRQENCSFSLAIRTKMCICVLCMWIGLNYDIRNGNKAAYARPKLSHDNVCLLCTSSYSSNCQAMRLKFSILSIKGIIILNFWLSDIRLVDLKILLIETRRK